MSGGDAVQQIKERLSIVDVISPYVELHKAGKNFKGKSPFTNEKTPSFYVSPDKGMYYCFSSSQGGDMFTFVQVMEGVDFKGALKFLADKAGVELVPEDPQVRNERETGHVILEEAASFFFEKRLSNGEVGSYLTSRGVSTETIAKWRIGYAPGPPHGGWRELRTHLESKGFTDMQLLKAGLIKTTEAGKEPYDVFRDRVMFPIFDASGKVIAFSGRILSKDSDAPKYVNSPETEFFNKSEVLYGYDKAKQGIRHYDFALIVEGQFDVVLAHQAGYTNTVAVSGTALTTYHVSLLQRLSNRVVLALDADRAGIAAVKRAAELMLARGIDLKVARLPEGKDPADLVREDVKMLRDVVGRATHVIEFLLYILKEEARDERMYKLRVREEVLPYVATIENSIDAEHFEQVIARAIETSVEAVHLEVVRTRDAHKDEVKSSFTDARTGNEKPESSVTKRKLELQEYLIVAVECLTTFDQQVLREAVETLFGKAHEELVNELGAEVLSKLTFLLESQFEQMSVRELRDDLQWRIRELARLRIRTALEEKRQALKDAELKYEDNVMSKLLQDIHALEVQLRDVETMELSWRQG